MPPQLRLFGTPALVYDEAPNRLAAPAKALALLGLLAAQPGQALDRAWLASALYPEEPETEARLAARRQLHVLGKLLPENAFVLTKNTVRLSDSLATDVGAFLAGGGDSETAALRTGDYCAGVFDDALSGVRETLDRRYAALLQRLLEGALAANDSRAAVLHLERLIALDALDETRVRMLMEMRFAQGDRSGALREYHALAQRLRADLDVEPERETTALFQRMLFSAQAAETPHNLSAPSTSFVGRERELEDLAVRMREHVLVTILGPPGVGKTRLARRLALDALEEFADGVWFVDLAPLHTDSEVYEQVLGLLKTRPAAGEDPCVAISAALRGKRALFILDNCEHVGASAAHLAQTLVANTSCSIIATSRRRLALQAESLFPLEPMDTPPPGRVRADDIKGFSAVRLFAERAVAVSPSLRITDENASAVSAIVRKLDGMPLALELVSARANLLTIDGMLKRLSERLTSGTHRTADARYATVEGAIAWSYELLSESERRLFEALAVFSGSWDVEAAEAICARETADVFSTLSELVESSLVRTERTGEDIRYSMFETTLAYARERFLQSGRADDLAEKHARYYCELAEKHSRHFKTEREIEFYRKTGEEYENLRAALLWAHGRDPELGARLVAALWRYAIFTWRMREVEPLAAYVFEHAAQIEPRTLADVYLASGMFAKERMEQEQAERHLGKALTLFRDCGEAAGETDVLYALGVVKFNHGDASAAREFYEQCLVLMERAGDSKAIAATTANLGAVAHKLGDAEAAAVLFRRALAGFRATSNERGIAYAYRALSVAYDDLERYEEAVDAAQRCVEAYEALGEQSRLADGLLTLGNALASVDRIAESYDAFARAFAALARAPHPLFEGLALLGYATTAQRAGDDLEAVRAASKGLSQMRDQEMGLGVSYTKFVDDLIERAKEALGAEQFEAAWVAGRRIPTETFAKNARAQAGKISAQ